MNALGAPDPSVTLVSMTSFDVLSSCHQWRLMSSSLRSIDTQELWSGGNIPVLPLTQRTSPRALVCRLPVDDASLQVVWLWWKDDRDGWRGVYLWAVWGWACSRLTLHMRCMRCWSKVYVRNLTKIRIDVQGWKLNTVNPFHWFCKVKSGILWQLDCSKVIPIYQTLDPLWHAYDGKYGKREYVQHVEKSCMINKRVWTIWEWIVYIVKISYDSIGLWEVAKEIGS